MVVWLTFTALGEKQKTKTKNKQKTRATKQRPKSTHCTADELC